MATATTHNGRGCPWRRLHSLRARGLFLVAIPVVAVVLASAGSAMYAAHQGVKDSQTIDRIRGVRTSVYELLDALNQAEADTLQWHITGSPDALSAVAVESARGRRAVERLTSVHADPLDKLALPTRVNAVLAGIATLTTDRSANDAVAADAEAAMDQLRPDLTRVWEREGERVGQSLAASARTQREVLRLGTAVTVVFGLGGVVFGLLFFTGGITQRIKALNRNARSLVEGGNLGLVPARGDEIDELAGELATASELLRTREQSLRQSEDRLAEAQRVAKMGSWEWDPETGKAIWSDEEFRQYGWEPDEVEASYEAMLDRLHPEDRPRVKQINDSVIRNGGDVEYETRVVTVQGETRWVRHTTRSAVDDSGVPVRLHGVTQDITERKAFEEQLAHNSLHDPLTGLPNRLLLLDRLARAMANRSRRGGTVAVLGLDLDRFKVVNDSLGHAAGDELLVEVGKRLLHAVREGDTVARFGGDEFVLLCEQVEGPDAAVGVGERVLAALERPVRVCGTDVRVSTSVGIAYSDDDVDPDELVRSADLAMYKAKAHGGAHIEVFDQALNYQALSRLELEADLRRGIEEGQFRVFYQPVIALESGAAVGVEALVRWDHPERGLVSPADFIPLAEETGLIVPLGSWVLRQACRQVAEWQRFGADAEGLSLSVNVSARQFADAALSETIRKTLKDSGLHPETLFLEITESTVMSDPEASAGVLRDLKLLGVSVSVDDFGTGYSSMATLKELPVDVLKIDRAFVSGVDGGPEDRAIVAAVARLADALELDVVAEGVERPAQAVALRRLGCGYAQGFGWSPPLPATEAREWLDAHSRAEVPVMTGDAVERYTVVVADDLPEHRAIVRRVLERNGSFAVVAEGSDGREAVDLAALHQPDVLVLDIAMPILDGVQALPLIRQTSPASRIVLMSGDVSRVDPEDADAVLEKGLAPHRLVSVLLEVLALGERELEAQS